MDRRGFLKVTAATGVVLALPGCTTATPATTVTAIRRQAPRSAPTRSAWAALERGLAGDLVRPGEVGFAHAKRLYNPRFDQITPAAVVRAANTSDVAETIGFARRHGIALRPRSGGHSYVGASSVEAASCSTWGG